MSELAWNHAARSFVEDYSLDQRLVEDVVRKPDHIERDPHEAEVGYPVRRLRRGDITVVVGFREPDRPTILFVRLNHPGERVVAQRGAGTGSGSAPAPSTLHEILRQATARGYEVRYGKHVHLHRNGKLAMSLSATPSDRNGYRQAWRDFMRIESEREKEEK